MFCPSYRRVMDHGHAIELSLRIERDGFAAHEGAVRRLLVAAARLGVAPAALTVVGDRSAPVVARLRALDRVVAALRPSMRRPVVGGRVARAA